MSSGEELGLSLNGKEGAGAQGPIDTLGQEKRTINARRSALMGDTPEFEQRPIVIEARQSEDPSTDMGTCVSD